MEEYSNYRFSRVDLFRKFLKEFRSFIIFFSMVGIFLASFALKAEANSFTIYQNYGIVCNQIGEMTILDLSDSAKPQVLSEFTPEPALHIEGHQAMAICQNCLLIADKISGLHIFNLQNPLSPTLLTVFSLPGSSCVATCQQMAYVVYEDNQRSLWCIAAIDLTNPQTPVLAWSFELPCQIEGLVVKGPFLYLATRDEGLQLLDCSVPEAPGLWEVCYVSSPQSLCLQNNDLLLADLSMGLVAISLPEDEAPFIRDSLQVKGARRVSQNAGRAIVVGEADTLTLIDISNPASMNFIKEVQVEQVDDLKARNGYIYVLNSEELMVFDNNLNKVQSNRSRQSSPDENIYRYSLDLWPYDLSNVYNYNTYNYLSTYNYPSNYNYLFGFNPGIFSNYSMPTWSAYPWSYPLNLWSPSYSQPSFNQSQLSQPRNSSLALTNYQLLTMDNFVNPYSSLNPLIGQYGWNSGASNPVIPIISWLSGGWSSYNLQIPISKPTGDLNDLYRSPVAIRMKLSNPKEESVEGEITLTLVDLDREIISAQTDSLRLEGGQETYALRLKKVPENTQTEDMANYIVKYTFEGDDVTLSGQKSLFYLADKMEVRINGPDSFYAGKPTYLGIHSFVQGHLASVDDAEVTVELVKGDETYCLYEGTSDEEGLTKALLNMSEDDLGPGKIRFKVTSSLGTEELEQNIEIIRPYKIFLTTDKPLYQPGQTIHVRTLTLCKPDLEPDANQIIIIEAEDPKGNKVFRVAQHSNDFGLASADLVLGRDINMGVYTIRALRQEGDQITTSEKKVTVKRYVLPKFKVELQTDTDYYQPGAQVNGVVQALYLFGKPVSLAGITIEAYTYDVGFELFQTMNGQTDESGFFSFTLSLPAYFVGLPLEQGDTLVKIDVKVMDSAEHEEIMSKELTISLNPIHISLIPESGQIVPGVENIFYLMTTDPIGRGLATSNDISVGEGFSQQVNTDEMGLGQFTMIPDFNSSLTFQVISQSNGQSVTENITLSEDTLQEQSRILLRTDQSLYTVGQTMAITLYTPEVEGRRVFVDIIREGQTLLTMGVDIINGYGRLLLDVSDDMKGTLLVEAYYISVTQETASDVFRDKKIVYVNQAEEIQISAVTDKSQYLPGERAGIDFQVTPAQPTALGITIVDEAVYALQENKPGLLKVFFSMEEEFMKPRFWPLLFPFEEAITSENPGLDVQQAAEVAFAAMKQPSDPGLSKSTYPNLVQRMKESLVSRIDRDAEKIVKDLKEAYTTNTNYSYYYYYYYYYQNAIDQVLMKRYLDPWGNEYTLNVEPSKIILTSCGPDEICDTLDDIELSKPYQVQSKYGGWLGPAYPVWGVYPAYGGWGANGGGDTLGGGGTDTSADFSTSEGYLTSNDEGGQTTPTGQEEQEQEQEPRKIRRDFPETLLWEPSLITDENGMAHIDTNMADSITTWRMSTTASNLDGKLGGVTDQILVFQDFFIDLDLPVTLTRDDEISLPVAIYNYLDEAQSVRVQIDVDQNNSWFQLMDDESERVVNLASGQVTSVNFRIRAQEVGWHELTVFGYGPEMSDAISRRIEVVPNGLEAHVNFSDRLDGSGVAKVVPIPAEAIDNASKILVKIYPGIFSQVLEGLDNMFKVPYGCFTQSTTVTWPNVLALDYMISSNQLTPEIEMKARQYINQGYQRLLTFECPNGGFSWYGKDPGKPVLTAYGLMEFKDMARVHYVDPGMITRTRDWLIGKQQSDGSWPPDTVRELFNVLNNNLQCTAYAVWALIHSGHPENASGIIKAKDYIKTSVESTEDNYTLALCAHAMLEGNPTDPTGLAILERLEQRKIVEGDTVHWTTAEKESFTYTRGNCLGIETTALITYALIQANWRYPQVIDKAINYIVQQKSASGLWGQTQASVLCLRVLILSMGNQVESAEGEILLTINGQVLDKNDLPVLKINPVDSSILRLIDLKPYTIEGDNLVNINLTGDAHFLYQITGSYYLPWNVVTMPSVSPLSIEVAYDKTTLSVDDTIWCTVTVSNNVSDTTTRMGMIDLGIPPGFKLFFEDFEKAMEEDKIVKYESTNRQLTIYLHPVQHDTPLIITYRLQAKYPLRVSTPKSKVYEYYNPEINAEVEPIVLTVN